MHRPLIVSCGVIAFVTFAQPCLGDWLTDGNPVSPTPGLQFRARLLSDECGGVFVAWEDGRSDLVQVRVSRFTASGDLSAGWPETGVAPGRSAASQAFSQIVQDGEGGAFLTWTGSVRDGVYAQRVMPWGSIARGWPLEGVAVRNQGGGSTTLTSDGTGSMVMAWSDFESDDKSDHDIIAQRLGLNGIRSDGWPTGGLVLDSTQRNDVFPRIQTNGRGGAYIVFQTFPSADVLAYHLDASGAFASTWPSRAIAVCDAFGDQRNAVITGDGGQGAFVAWDDSREDQGDIYANRLVPIGGADPTWPVNGLAVCRAPGGQESPAIASVNEGLVIAWSDARDSTSRDVYANLISASAMTAPGWLNDGIPVCIAPGDQFDAAVTSDGAGGSLVAWTDQRSDGGDIYVQHLTALGSVAPGWPTDGIRVCGAPGIQQFPEIASDGAGGAFVAWTDRRNPSVFASFLARITAAGATGPDIPIEDRPDALEVLPVRPNPASGSRLIAFRLAEDTRVSVEILDVAGRSRRLITRNELFRAGTRGVIWNGCDHSGDRVPPGVYFVHLRTRTELATRKVVVLD